jgi:hypothetical protein
MPDGVDPGAAASFDEKLAREGASSSATNPNLQNTGANQQAQASHESRMPGVGAALMQGVWHGGRDLAQTGAALAGGRPDANPEQSPAAAPLQWSDLLSPGSKLAPKLAYQLGSSWPTVAGGVAGTSIGIAAAGGPEDPAALVTGPVGGALGAGLMNGLQTFGNYFGEELHKTPNDADGAYSRALDRATVSGVFSSAAWAAFPARAFQGPLKNMMFQAFGVQPGLNMAHQAADNALTGKPLTKGLGDAYTQGAIGTLPIAGGHYLGTKAGEIASRYELQVDPNALGSNGGNIRIVKKAGTGQGAPEAGATPEAGRIEAKGITGLRVLATEPGNASAKGDAVKASIAAMERAKATASALKDDPAFKGKVVASDGINTRSGWKGELPEGYGQVSPEAVRDYSKKIGYSLTPKGAEDQVSRGGFPGKSRASDAEKQLAMAKPDHPIGVSKPMCGDCQKWFQQRAIYEGKPSIVTDPEATRIFWPDGHVETIPTPQK